MAGRTASATTSRTTTTTSRPARPGPKFNCAAPVNNSPNNTGLTNLPPAKPADDVDGLHARPTPRNPGLGTGGAPTGGPRYKFDPDLDSDTKFPAFYDGQWFIGEWNNGWIKTATLNADDDRGHQRRPDAVADTFIARTRWSSGLTARSTSIDWGSGFNGNNVDSGIYRIDYVKGARRPIAHARGQRPTPARCR